MKNKLMLAVIATAVISIVIARYHESRFFDSLYQKDVQVHTLQKELKQTKEQLAVAQVKLGYLDKYKQNVQVTAYTAAPGSVFHNGMRTEHAYAVRGHVLPNDRLIYVGLSIPAQERLHAKLNDFIVLVSKHNNKKVLAKFVDTGSTAEMRPVVDIYFADEQQAIIWGRKTEYYAVNVSVRGSPFRKRYE